MGPFIPHGIAKPCLLAQQSIHLHEAANSATRSWQAVVMRRRQLQLAIGNNCVTVTLVWLRRSVAQKTIQCIDYRNYRL